MKDRFGQWLMHRRLAAVLPLLRGRVLDIGCGTNELVRRWAARGGDRARASVGVDVFNWGGADLIVPDTSRLPWPDASFDTVTIIAALNHIPNRHAVLRECRRLVAPQGQLLLTMLPPRISQAWHFLRRPWDADQIERGMQPGEVYGLTGREVDRLLADAGFETRRTRRFMLGINRLTVAHPVLVPAPVAAPVAKVPKPRALATDPHPHIQPVAARVQAVSGE